MSLYAYLEPLLVGLIVAASLLFALRRFVPRLFSRTSQPGADDCSNGCGSCSNCGPSPATRVQTITLHRKKHAPDT